MEASFNTAGFLSRHKFLFLLLLAVVLAYLTGLPGGFVIDDRTYFIDNDLLPQLRPWQLREIFLTPSNYWGELLPLRDFFYVLQYRVFAENPFGYHLVSLLLYLLVIVATANLIATLNALDGVDRSLFLPSGFALAFFALHPLHVESVAYISGQKDLLCVLFSFLAIVRAIKLLQPGATSGKRDIALFLLCYYAAFLAKNLAVATALILSLVVLFYWWGDSARRWRLLGGWVVFNLAPIVWLYYNVKIAKGIWAGVDELSAISFLDRLLRGMRIVGEHFQLLLWPANLNFGYPFATEAGIDASFWVGLGGVLFLCLVFFKCRLLRVKFGVLLILFYLLPVSQLFHDFHNAAIYDRYLFVPVLGVAILVGHLLQWFFASVTPRWPIYSVAAVCLIVLGVQSHLYVPVYRSDVSVAARAYSLFPDWNATSFNLAVALIEAGNLHQARVLLGNEPALASPAWVPGYLLGLIALEEGASGEAIAYLQPAFWLAASGGYFPYAAVPLARSYKKIGEEQRAISVLQSVLNSPIVNPLDYYQAKKLKAEIGFGISQEGAGR